VSPGGDTLVFHLSLVYQGFPKVFPRLAPPDSRPLSLSRLALTGLVSRSLTLASVTLDADQVKLSLESTKVVGYREEMRESHTSGTSTGRTTASGKGGGSFQGTSTGDGKSGADSYDRRDPDNETTLQSATQSAEGWNSYIAESSGESGNWTESESESETSSESTTRSSVLIPIMGKEVSSVQYRSIEEQMFQAMQKLFDQQDRHFAIRFHGGPRAPLFVKTPTVAPAATREERIEAYRRKLLGNLAFAMPMAEAEERISGRERKLIAEIVDVHQDDRYRRGMLHGQG
jgi:hypothetical protein